MFSDQSMHHARENSPESRTSRLGSSRGTQKNKALLPAGCLQVTSSVTPPGQERHPVVTTSQTWNEVQVNSTTAGHSPSRTGGDDKAVIDQDIHANRESQLIKLMETQIQSLEVIQQQMERATQGISEQQFQRLEELFKRHIEEALPAATPHVLQCQEANERDNTMPLPRTTNEATTPLPFVPADVTNGAITKNITKPLQPVKDSVQRMLTMSMREMMEMGQSERFSESSHSWQMHAFQMAATKDSHFYEFLIKHGMPTCFLAPKERPDNFLVHIIDKTWFHALTVIAIILNTVFGAWEAHVGVFLIMRDPPEYPPAIMDTIELVFTIYFIAELALRMIALRAYFFFEKGQVVWNMLDLFVCSVSLVASNFNIVFFRMLRVFRLVRLVRVICETKALVALRNLLYAVMACMVPLLWAVLFLVMTMLMFTLLILQCISSQRAKIIEDESLRASIRTHFMGFEGCLKTLSIAVAGEDWVAPHDVLSGVNAFSALVMPVFVVFVNIGVMNVVIGVFADAADGRKDRNAIAEAEIESAASFSRDMIQLVADDAGVDAEGSLGWEQFKTMFYRQGVQAYLSAHGLDTSHVKLVYHLLDGSHDGAQDGTVDIKEFVIGLLSLKGMAKRLDQQVALHALHTLVEDVQLIRHELEQRFGSTGVI